MSATDVVTMLNHFFTEMVEIIETRHEGMVNKFLGDGFMALFGAGEIRDDHAAAAVAAGRDMLDHLATLNAQLVELGMEPLSIGVGVHTGPAIVGSVGSPHRMEYTAIGDTVNTASRIEGLTKAVGAPLLFTAATRNRLPAELVVRALAPSVIRGKDEPLELFTLEPAPGQRSRPPEVSQ
jgi:adenylate cyclase